MPRLTTLKPKVKRLSTRSAKGNRVDRLRGKAWTDLRRLVFERDNGLCQLCANSGVVERATDVDHIVTLSDGGSNALANLQALCRACHEAKTAEENKGGC